MRAFDLSLADEWALEKGETCRICGSPWGIHLQIPASDTICFNCLGWWTAILTLRARKWAE